MVKFQLLSTTEDVEPGGSEEIDGDTDADDDVLMERWESPGFGRSQYHSVRTVDLGSAHDFARQTRWERLRKPVSTSIGLVLAAGVVLNLVVHLYKGAGTKVSRQVATTRDMVVESMSVDGTFDCAAGYDKWEEGWSATKRAWCCEHESKACPLNARPEVDPTKRVLTTMMYSYVPEGQSDHSTCDGAGTSWGQWGRQGRAESLEACQKLCSETSECEYVQWQADRQVCHLYQRCDRKRTCDPHGYKCGVTYAKSGGDQGNTSIDESGECGSCPGGGCSSCGCTCTFPTDVVKEEVTPPTVPEESFACSMSCDLNCYQGTGAEDVSLTQDVTPGADLGSCRKACEDTPGCDGIVWAKDNSHCSGRKHIHLAKCQPGDKYVTEICRQKPMGKCAILGDPHIRQFDNIYGNFVNDYDAGDFSLVRSSIVNVHARFGFTKQFPKATSLIGLAVAGAALQAHSLVVVHTGQGSWQDGFAVYWDGGRILEGYPSEFNSGKLKARFGSMDPSDYHREARDTIGDSEERSGKSLPSYHFEIIGLELTIYCLLGPDSMNAIIEMRKLDVEMDGLCGNFDCKPENDVKASLRQRGLADPLADSESIFAKANIKAAQVQRSTDHTTAILAKCQSEHAELYGKAQSTCATFQDQPGKEACLVDICEGGNVNVGSLDVAAEMVENEIEADIDAGKNPSDAQVVTDEVSPGTPPRQAADIPGVSVPSSCHCTCKICGCNTCGAPAKKAFCSSYACPKGYVQRSSPERIQCASEVCTSEDIEVCCNKIESTCETFTCPTGYTLKADAAERKCRGAECNSSRDLNTCCDTESGGLLNEKASCATMKCPEGYALTHDADNTMCEGAQCNAVNGSQDVQFCCEASLVAAQADCSTLACPAGMALKDQPKTILCQGEKCSVEKDAETCCNASVAEEPFNCSMTCGWDCSEVNGTNLDLAISKLSQGSMSEDDCRDACENAPTCQGIVWNKKTQKCSAKKDIELSQCKAVDGDFITDVCRKMPLGKCSLLGDPHIRQWDNLFGKYVSVYDAGDYVMIDSSALKVHARFGFTEEFPDATSTTGIAMWGQHIKGNSLAVIYLGPIGWENGFKVYWNKEPILKEFPSEYKSSDGFLKAKWDKMDPEHYHKEARHTIGDTEETDGKDLPSFYFEFEGLDMNMYVLLGPDSMNCVIEMRKLKVEMDGLCGNFNCDAKDDAKKEMKKRGYWEPLLATDSVFKKVGLPDASVHAANGEGTHDA